MHADKRLGRRGDAGRRVGRCDLRLDCRPMPTSTRSFRAARCERLEAAGIDRSSLSVVWRSALLRYGPHALRSGLDAELREDAGRVPDRAQGNRSPTSTIFSKRIAAAASSRSAPPTMRPAIEMVRRTLRSRLRAGPEKCVPFEKTVLNKGSRFSSRSRSPASSCAAADSRFPSSRCCRRPPSGRAASCPRPPR